MEKQQDLNYLKARSYRSILSAGFRLYTDNFRRLFKASWLMAVVYALVQATLGTLITIQIPRVEVSFASYYKEGTTDPALRDIAIDYLITMGVLLGLMLLVIILAVMASAPIISKLEEHKTTGAITTPPSWWKVDRHLMGRTTKATLFTLPFVILLSIIFPFLLPFSYVVMSYIMTPGKRYWPTLWTAYKKGMSHWGMLFLVYFVSLLVVAIACTIIGLPEHILAFANQQAQMGLLNGDELGMPTYMPLLTFVTFTLSGFLQFYIIMVNLVHNYYICGTIEANDNE